jgi:hypothetical protein
MSEKKPRPSTRPKLMWAQRHDTPCNRTMPYPWSSRQGRLRGRTALAMPTAQACPRQRGRGASAASKSQGNLS